MQRKAGRDAANDDAAERTKPSTTPRSSSYTPSAALTVAVVSSLVSPDVAVAYSREYCIDHRIFTDIFSRDVLPRPALHRRRGPLRQERSFGYNDCNDSEHAPPHFCPFPNSGRGRLRPRTRSPFSARRSPVGRAGSGGRDRVRRPLAAGTERRPGRGGRSGGQSVCSISPPEDSRAAAVRRNGEKKTPTRKKTKKIPDDLRCSAWPPPTSGAPARRRRVSRRKSAKK